MFGHWWAVALLSAAVCALLVCGIPFFSFKGGKKEEGQFLTENMKRIAFACMSSVVIILAAVLSWHWSAVPLGISLVYILENIVLLGVRH